MGGISDSKNDFTHQDEIIFSESLLISSPVPNQSQ